MVLVEYYFMSFLKKIKLLIILPIMAVFMQSSPVLGQASEYHSYYRYTESMGNTLSVNYGFHPTLGYDDRSSYNSSRGLSLGFESAPFGQDGLEQMINGFVNVGMMTRLHTPNGELTGNNSFFSGDAGLRIGYIFNSRIPSLAFRPHFDFNLNYRAIKQGTDNLATTAAIKVDIMFSNPYSNSFLQGVREIVEIGSYMDTRINPSSTWGGMIGRRLDFNFKLAFNLDPQ